MRTQKRKGAFHEPLGAPPGFGVRQSSGAFTSGLETEKSGRGLPQSKTLPRGPQGSWSQCVRKSEMRLSMNRKLRPPSCRKNHSGSKHWRQDAGAPLLAKTNTTNPFAFGTSHVKLCL